jgi:hypothetical protein
LTNQTSIRLHPGAMPGRKLRQEKAFSQAVWLQPAAFFAIAHKMRSSNYNSCDVKTHFFKELSWLESSWW